MLEHALLLTWSDLLYMGIRNLIDHMPLLLPEIGWHYPLMMTTDGVEYNIVLLANTGPTRLYY